VKPAYPLPEEFDRRQMELYREATPTAKLAVVARLNAVLVGLKQARLAAEHPAWTAAERTATLRQWWFGARDR
jgi:hypothetical protein